MRGVTPTFRALLLAFQFQLTRLMRGVTAVRSRTIFILTFQLTRLMRGVTLHIHEPTVNI